MTHQLIRADNIQLRYYVLSAQPQPQDPLVTYPHPTPFFTLQRRLTVSLYYIPDLIISSAQ